MPSLPVTDVYTDAGPIILNETLAFSANFSPYLGAGVFIESASVSAVVESGSDSNPSLTLIGTATINGRFVTQLIKGLIAGNTYWYIFQANCNDGQKPIIVGKIPVVQY